MVRHHENVSTPTDRIAAPVREPEVWQIETKSSSNLTASRDVRTEGTRRRQGERLLNLSTKVRRSRPQTSCFGFAGVEETHSGCSGRP